MRGDLEVHLDRFILMLYLLQLSYGYSAFGFFEATLVRTTNIAVHCGVIISSCNSDCIPFSRIR